MHPFRVHTVCVWGGEGVFVCVCVCLYVCLCVSVNGIEDQGLEWK